MSKNPATTFVRAQNDWAAADAQVAHLEVTLRARYSNEDWAPAKLRADLAKQRKRRAKALNTALTILREVSPWNWEQGPSCRWIMTSLPWEMVVASNESVAVQLPEEAASYGMPQAPFYLSRRC